VPSRWLRKRSKDQFHRLATQRGFRSRASFKLLQIVNRFGIIRRGDSVLDLGAAPGSWLQAARQIVGEKGYVLGVDKQPIRPLFFDNVETITADIAEENIVDQISAKCSEKFDAVVSDISPNVSGVWEVDHARQIELARCSLRIARNVLRTAGNLLVKVFQGSELKDFQREMEQSFRTLRIVKPPASRPESAELYFLGLGFLG